MKDFKDIEKKLRNGKLPDADMTKRQNQIWRRILLKQRKRRDVRKVFSLVPWIWAFASIIIIVIFLIYVLTRS